MIVNCVAARGKVCCTPLVGVCVKIVIFDSGFNIRDIREDRLYLVGTFLVASALREK